MGGAVGTLNQCSMGVHSGGNDWNKKNCVRYELSDCLEFLSTKWLATIIVYVICGDWGIVRWTRRDSNHVEELEWI